MDEGNTKTKKKKKKKKKKIVIHVPFFLFAEAFYSVTPEKIAVHIAKR